MNPEHFHTDIVIPGRPFALESQARLGGVGFVRTNQVQHDLLEQGEVLRGVVFADHAVVLAEADVEHPVQAVLDGPVRAHDPGGDLALAAHGIDAHQQALDVQGFEQLGDGSDPVALARDFLLAEHQPQFGREGADHVDRWGVTVGRTAQCLAVDGEHANDPAHPAPEHRLERLRYPRSCRRPRAWRTPQSPGSPGSRGGSRCSADADLQAH